MYITILNSFCLWEDRRGLVMFLHSVSTFAMVRDLDNHGADETLKVVELLRFDNGRVAELTPFYFDAAQVHRCARKA